MINPGQLEMHFNPVELVAGAGVGLVSRAYQDKKFDIHCYANFQHTGRVSMLSCTHLGQTIDTEHNVEFAYFTYNLDGGKILDLKVTQLGADFNTKNPKECDKTIVAPKEGNILVHEICPPPQAAKPVQEIPIAPTSPLVQPKGKDIQGMDLGTPSDVPEVLDNGVTPGGNK
jgi:hypothetical protein